jgi:hypothetical protein
MPESLSAWQTNAPISAAVDFFVILIMGMIFPRDGTVFFQKTFLFLLLPESSSGRYRVAV